MNYFSRLAVVVALISVVHCQLNPTDPTDPSQYTCTIVGAECAPTCAHMMSCAVIGQPPLVVNLCATSRPYCNRLETTNACSATPGPASATCDAAHASDFACTSAGVFPDASNCSQFFTCTGPNGKSETIACPIGQFYDSIVQACVTQKNRCTTVKCHSNKNTLLAYKTNPTIYVQCAGGEQFVHRCTEGSNTVFDQAKQQCVYNCTEAGNFPDREDCTRFYTCTSRGSKFTSSNGVCPAGSNFVNTKCVVADTPCVPEIA